MAEALMIYTDWTWTLSPAEWEIYGLAISVLGLFFVALGKTILEYVLKDKKEDNGHEG